MARNTTKPKSVRSGRERQPVIHDETRPATPVRKSIASLKPMNEVQSEYMGAIRSAQLTIATGCAGTGKTYIAAGMAAEALASNRIEKIIITRPALEAGESLGFLPGELADKFDPYLQPFKDVLYERLGKSHVDLLIKRGIIEAAPLGFMRGRTFRNAFVILDEAQNATKSQMKLFLTRIGEGCTTVVNGDERQTDLPRGMSGLADAVMRLKSVPEIRHVVFTREDIVRSGLVQTIVERYEDDLPGQ